MKSKAMLWMSIAVLAAGVAWVGRQRLAVPGAQASQAAEKAQRKILYYVDPMHPQYKSDKPGIAPDCGMKLIPVYADEMQAGGIEQPGGPALPPGTVRISAEKQQLIGVKYGQVELRHLTRTIRAVGRLDHPETGIASIHSKVEGWIDQVFVDFTGKLVEKGQPLLTLYSPDLLATQKEFLLAARARRELASSPFPQVAAGGDSLYDAARKRLELWDISDQQIQEIERKGEPQKTLTLYSPISGFVMARNAYPRQRITPETELYRTADHHLLWVLAEVYEYEAPLVKEGMPAGVTVSYLPGEVFRAKVTYIYPEVNPATHTLKVRLEIPNHDLRLHPDMYANVTLVADFGRQVAVPEDAVLDSGAERTVFVDRGNGYLEPRRVDLGDKMDGWYIVRKGLAAGERVVTSGNFLVDSESRLKSALGAMGGMPGMGGGEKQEKPVPTSAPPKEGHVHD